MTRRALSPAARGVLLAVSAALRGRVATIDDAASDGLYRVRIGQRVTLDALLGSP